MNQRLSIILVLLVLPLAWLAGTWLQKNQQESNPLPVSRLNFSDCIPWEQPCSVTHKGYHVVLHFVHQPDALKPFDIFLTADGIDLQQANINFEMTGMDMGFNQFQFVRDGKKWKASAVLPVCSLGRSDWLARLQIVTEDSVYESEIPFQMKARSH